VDDLAIDRDRDIGASEIVAADELQCRGGQEQERRDAEKDRGQEPERKGKTSPWREAPNGIR
jgi:hypothetical protein